MCLEHCAFMSARTGARAQTRAVQCTKKSNDSTALKSFSIGFSRKERSKTMEQTMRMEHQLDAKPINRHFTQKPSQAKLGL